MEPLGQALGKMIVPAAWGVPDAPEVSFSFRGSKSG